ncbi:MAG: phage major tail tube protein [Gammaproteobacteria bacterium]|nr:phage major tail tube protein [Gammaproteobacteria bacterium]
MLPNLIKDAMLSVEGVGYAGQIDISQMPKTARKMEDYWAGGMSGPIEIDMGAEKLEMEFEAHGVDADLLKQYGKTGVAGVGFRINASVENDDDVCTTKALEIIGRGRFREIDPGGHKAGDKGSVKYSVALASIKYTMDGEDIIEIDNANYIFKVNGNDLLEKRRRALKL